MPNALHYGDNLYVLRDRTAFPDASVDLIYLDPPFNSNATYNVLFKAPSGKQSQAQIEAFEDTWHWSADNGAELAFDEVMRSGNAEAANMLRAIRSFLGENDMMAYLAMMAVRLLELHRVLKPTGSLYLHCDPVASHYLKILLDSVFGATRFRNEVIWKRTHAHGGADRWGDVHDTLLFYSKTDRFTWTRTLQELDPSYISGKYRFHDERGQYRLVVLTGSGTRRGASGTAWRGYNPTTAGRHWAVPHSAIAALEEQAVNIPHDLHAQLELLYQHGFIRFPQKKGGTEGVPEFKLYLPNGQPVQDIILDIPPINSQAIERLGYPTQKPVALLERLISASSNEGDVVLDPFCGCGTAVHAAQKLKRQWIGIDITHLAIGLIERRLKDAFPGIKFNVHGTPKDFAGAEDLARRDKFQFQWWAVTLINAVPYGGKKKGADTGIDGYFYCKPDGKKTEAGIVSVKGGDTVHRNAVGELRGVMEREKAPLAVLITLREPTGPMVKEAASAGFFDTPFGRFPRVQIATVANLLEGKLPRLPPQERGGGYKRAEREEPTQGKLL